MAGPELLKLLSVICLAMFLQSAQACYKRLVYHGEIPLLYIDDCTSNYELGLLVGETFSSTIKGRMRDSLAFQKVQAYCSTNWGRELLTALEDRHRIAFPAYFSELQGLAAGSGVPFDQIFMLNLRQEILAAGESPEVLQGFQQWLTHRNSSLSDGDSFNITQGAPAHLPGDDGIRTAGQRAGAHNVIKDNCSGGGGIRSRGDVVHGGGLGTDGSDASGSGTGGGGGTHIDPTSVDACSDVGVRLPGSDGPLGAAPHILLGHNEDMTNDTLGRMYFIRATMPLASTAFGANTAGVAFTLNALYPRGALLPGLGRNFLSRRLLDSSSVEDALEVLAVGDQATGRSVNLMSTKPPIALWNVE
ncbi:hypothetical protein VOLCADRAFT_100042, partial [Volvox carteri f. nagariensis]